jgi:hypothetical protein
LKGNVQERQCAFQPERISIIQNPGSSSSSTCVLIAVSSFVAYK